MSKFGKTNTGSEYGWFIGKHEEGIVLNDLEYMLDENNLIKLFDTKEEAISFLKAHGLEDDDIDDLRFFVHTKCLNCGEEQDVFELEMSEDDLGTHATCDNCLSTFDITM